LVSLEAPQSPGGISTPEYAVADSNSILQLIREKVTNNSKKALPVKLPLPVRNASGDDLRIYLVNLSTTGCN